MTDQLDIFAAPVAPPYNGTPGFKEKGGTSELAAREVRSRAASVREAVLDAFIAAGPAGLTADEAAQIVSESILTTRPRCSELLLYKLIAKTGRTRKNASGKNATVMIAARYLGEEASHEPAG
ncbi:hypothetical protein [Ferrovibrio sp.]|uniref:hypothetical protein n=1 Tax=Ferrovibrio sp. TaxID=1917215 RepID=UPI00311D7854